VPAAPARLAVKEMPDLSLPDLAGNTRSLREWSSQALILNFWATWCVPCRKEMPLLEQVHQERGDKGLAVVGIAIDREEPVRTFIAETGVSYPILVGQEQAMAAAEAFGPDFVGLPLTVIAAPGGDIVTVHMGELDWEELAGIIDVLDRLAQGILSLTEAREALQHDAVGSQRSAPERRMARKSFYLRPKSLNSRPSAVNDRGRRGWPASFFLMGQT
jgi:thiol-disulfide isomerase/thioredoxin